jgi:pimeloyl-ACP methyl ester carboxylesterase
MSRILLALPAAAIALGTGCMSLDGLVIPEHPVDAYTLSDAIVPAELIEEVSFPSEDGTTLFGVWAHQPDPRPPLIYIHGNGGALDTDWYRVEHYWQWGDYDVFAFDYRGYGKSAGPASYDGILEQDGLAAIQYVAEAKGVDPSTIPVLALSLGAAVTVHTADETPLWGIVIESMFASTELLQDDSTGLELPNGWFFRETWDNVAAAADILSPVFIIHGKADDFIDPKAGIEVFKAAPDPKFIWRPEGVNHSDVLTIDPEGYDARVRSFLAHPADGPDPVE